MSVLSTFRLLPLTGLFGTVLLVAACGGDSNDNDPATGGGGGGPEATSLSGSVAVGAPVNGATVQVTCRSGNGVASVTSAVNGGYTAQIPNADFPCILRVTGGDLPAGVAALHSFAPSASQATVNVTPLTDLALALAVTVQDGRGLAAWFQDPDNWDAVSGGLSTAAGSLRTRLDDAGYSLPSSWPGSQLMAPFFLAFTPSATPAADTLDRLLEDLQAAIDAAASDYQTVLANITGGGAFPDPVEPDPTDPTDPTDPPTPQGAVASADLGDNAEPSPSEFLSVISRTWPVAIYDVPAEHPEWYGEGSLTIGGTTDNWTVTLLGADGGTIVSQSADGAITRALTPFSVTDFGFGPNYMSGQVFINQGTAITEFVNTFLEWDTGLIEGSAGGNGEVKFRNSVLAYGEGVPDIFDDLAGTWTGSAQVSCSGPFGPFTTVTNTITITEQGKFTLAGQTQLCGGVLPRENQWGGKDDFLIPGVEESDGAFLMQVDAQDLVNVSAGQVQIRFDETMAVIKMSAWVGGELFELRNVAKQ
ncbi:hypothetical protein LL252_03070 [Alcanivorax marinus]|uniref:Carboxypeptidase regulatory-like domain-containing protein n=1 Tax=Alloalcanivorax marinus TaxID=1177169 RepID=A0A9Q3UM51_9GAMM|nr:hypothetical protein [Alloalcanivorax marinus]MCC4307543.1 hypothetical protein [Alloalcanivorax marinus]